MELTLMHSRLGWLSSLHLLPRYLKKNKMKQQYEQHYVISTLKNVMSIQINFWLPSHQRTRNILQLCTSILDMKLTNKTKQA